MSKKKHPIFRLHKIKIHPNRWLLWAISYALIVTIAVVGYIKVSEIDFETESIAQSQYLPWHSYSNQALGFSLRIPADWSIDTTDSSTVNFVPDNSSDAGVSVMVLKASAEAAVRKGLHVLDQSQTMVDDLSATKILNNLGHGSTESVVLAKHNSKLYVLRGTDSLVNKLILTFNFQDQK